LLAFLWHDRYTITQTSVSAKTSIRVLDTVRPGRSLVFTGDLLDPPPSLGYVSSAYTDPAGGPLIVTTFTNSPAAGPTGTARLRILVVAADSGKIVKTISDSTLGYHGSQQYSKIVSDFSCEVVAQDASGHHQLVECPDYTFGRIDNGILTKLPAGAPRFATVAW
jgi:hypothetical protein